MGPVKYSRDDSSTGIFTCINLYQPTVPVVVALSKAVLYMLYLVQPSLPVSTYVHLFSAL